MPSASSMAAISRASIGLPPDASWLEAEAARGSRRNGAKHRDVCRYDFFARSRQDRDRLRPEAAQRVFENTLAWGIEPLDIVDCDQDRRCRREHEEDVEQGDADRSGLERRTVVHAKEGNFQRPPLGIGQRRQHWV